MNRLQYLLTKLAEESNELAQIALKTQQFGPNEVCPGQELTNAQRVQMEFNDVLAVVCLLNVEFDMKLGIVQELIDAKMSKVHEYHLYSRSLGMVE